MNYRQRRLAALDLGTNSLLMLAAERNGEGKLLVLADEIETPRLGEGLRETGKISEKALDRTCTSIQKLLTKTKDLNITEIFLTATASVREASNQDEVVQKISNLLEQNVEVLPPNEEGRLTYISVTTERGHEAPSMVADIGGGSTEITWGIGARFDGVRSLNIGTVKLLEGRLKNNPPSQDELEQTRKEIDHQLARVTPLGSLEHYYGTAGSFTHLASIDLELKSYTSEKVAGHQLTKERVTQWVDRISKMTVEERKKLAGVDPRRADVLLPGALIIERLFEKFKNHAFEVYDRGIRFGKLFDKLRGFIPPIHFQ